MKMNRDMVARAGLKLLNEVGLEQLTLRRLGVELNVQAATIYWHFKSKEELIDEMATSSSRKAPQTRSGTRILRLESLGLPPSVQVSAKPCSPIATVPAWSAAQGSPTRNT